MPEPAVYPVARLDLSFAPRPWPFAVARRGEIDAHFAELQRRKPKLWNGRVLLLYERRVEGDVFRGSFLEADYASFVAWQSWGRPDDTVYDCFGAAAVAGADGGILLGVMAQHTFNAGEIYFPCGTPDPSDIAGAKVDLDFGVRRELEEETGLTANDFAAAPGWTAVTRGRTIALIKVLRARETAEQLRARALAHLAREAEPELADIRIARGPGDLAPQMRGFTRDFLIDLWRGH